MKNQSNNHRTNYLSTLMHMLNGFIGSGILSMPITFKNGGLIFASLVMPLIGILSCHCIHMLIEINELAISIEDRDVPLEYHELAEFAFKTGPKTLRPFANISKYIVLIAISCTQIGACCVYYLFIATNLEKFFSLHNIIITSSDDNDDDDKLLSSKNKCLLLILPIMIVINYIRNINKLTFLSTTSNILQIFGILIIMYNILTQPWPEFPDKLPKIGDKIPQFFVSTLFIFEGISLSMSLYKTIEKSEQFSSKFGVINVGLSIIGVGYFCIGFFGYSCYGSKIDATITRNLTDEFFLNNIIQLIFAITVLLTYPILMFVPIQILWPLMNETKMLKNISTKKLLSIELFIFRTGLVLFTYIFALIVQKLDLIISLIGSITSSLIAVIIPSTLHLITFFPRLNTRKTTTKFYLLIKNLLIIIIGCTGFIFGTYFSIKDIIDSYY